MNLIAQILAGGLTVFIASYLLPGVKVGNFFIAIVVAVVLALVNAYIRPLVTLLTLPINILTLGLFTFVIIGALVLLVSAIVPGFHVDSFWWALAFAALLWLINSLFQPKSS